MKHLASKLQGEAELIRIPFAKFNHIDFTWAIDVVELVYKSVINNIEKHESKTNF